MLSDTFLRMENIMHSVKNSRVLPSSQPGMCRGMLMLSETHLSPNHALCRHKFWVQDFHILTRRWLGV